MAIQKQEYYEGAALHRLVSSGNVKSLIWSKPLFVVNEDTFLYVKYSTAKRSPWPFTFTSAELAVFTSKQGAAKLFVGFVCGADGIAALSLRDVAELLPVAQSIARVSCSRAHGSFYRISGPAKTTTLSVSPSAWPNIIFEQ